MSHKLGTEKINPLVSVIIPLYNSKGLLAKAIDSVILQNCKDIELIIIDGGSVDGSLDVINRYLNFIDYFVSEPDRGIYEAMNKGIDLARGKWLYFLGSDDNLEPNIVQELRSHLLNDIMMVYGDILYMDGERYVSFLNARTVLQNTVHHQGAFYNKKLFENFRYNTQLKILSDYELNLKIFMCKLPVVKVPLIIANCSKGGVSSSIALSIRETNKVRSVFVHNKFLNKIFSYALELYYIQKKIRLQLR